MITIRKKLAEQATTNQTPNKDGKDIKRRQSIRTQLLTSEVSELGEILPDTCKIVYNNPDELKCFKLVIKPEEGYWKKGTFCFDITVPTDYNNKPPNVKCCTRIWHPNINESGEVCLSILRETSIDGTGWSPARRIKDVILGLNSLFTDLLNFDDPLNLAAAEHFQKDKVAFARKAQTFVNLYASKD